MSGLLQEDVRRARELFESQGVGAMYDYLESKGDRYATLANGVAKGNSIAGIAAIDFMKRTEQGAGRPMQEEDVEHVRFKMAEAYLDLLSEKVKAGTIGVEVNHLEVWDFHSDVFKDLGRSKDAWTLNTIFDLLHPDNRQAYWEGVLDAAGSPGWELLLAVRTDASVAFSAAMAPEDLRARAASWKARIDSPGGLGAVVLGVGAVTANGIYGLISDLVRSDEPAPSQPIQIEITPTSESRRDLQGQDDIRNDVSAGYVNRRLTHSIAFTDNTLNNTDFTSAQLGSLATGGIRPGELQLDPNVRPNQHLAQFYQDATDQPDFSLRNAAVLNGLAAMTTVNTFVDPLLFDLSGQGAGLTGIEDAVLFDVDNSGQLRRTGWADRQTGMLVHDDGSGQVVSIRQLFSEYFGGQPGSNGAPGEAPFKDGFAALASVDANADGLITADDAAWAQLKLWVDANHDGRADAGELRALPEHGITQIDLRQVQPLNEVRQGNEVISRGAFVANGVEREVLAVKYLADTVGNLVEQQDGATVLTSISGATTRRSYVSNSPQGAELDAAVLGVDTVQGGAGDDVLKAATGGSWLVGGGGSNTYVGGAGDDVLVISASDQAANIHGNGGRDTALIVGEHGVGLNMAEAGLTIAQGGRGKDVIVSGGQRGVFIKGGSGDSLLIGGGGNDVLVGGTGRNTIIGGTGKAVIYAGPNGDRIQASAAGSIIHAGGGADQITGGAADDVIEAGRGNATIDGAGGINLVTLHGNHDEYLITRTATGYQVSDRQAERDGSLTLSNVQKISFADIAAVDLQGPGALPIGDTLAPEQMATFTTTPTALVIPASVLLANDQPLNSTGPLRIASVGDGKGATVRLNDQGDVEVTPMPGHDADVTFRYDLVDAAGNPSVGVTEVASGASASLRATVTLRHEQSPVDPLASRQWYLNEIDVQPVWRDFSGKGVRIGQFEPGGEFAVAPEIFDIQHPDLQANIDPIWLQTQRSNGTLPALASHHATQVAGVMVGARNDQGGIGVAYDAKLGGHYLANKGDDLTNLGQMVNYDIANHSWGFKTDFAIGNVPEGRVDTALALAFSATLAATNGRGGLGTVIVTSGGNQREQGGSAQGSLINNSRHAIEVAAVNAKADLSVLQVASAPFSNPGSSLLVAAPGSHVLSSGINLEAERGAKVGSAYGTTQGTSFAAPIVSGVVALMLQANPGLGYRDVQQILALSARKVEDPATVWRDNAGSNWNGGGMRASHDYGFGMVDARAAVRLAESWAGQASKANEQQLTAASEALAQVIAPGQVSTFALSMPAGVLVEHVEVDFHSQVGRLGDMTLTLISPGGTRSVLLDRAGKAPGSADDDQGNPRSGEFKYGFMSTHQRGERSVGEWRLEVSNAGNGLPLTLDRWALRVVGSPSNANDVYYYTNDYADAVAQNAARAVLDDAVNGTAGGRNTLNAAALSRSISVDLVSGIASIGGTALTLAPGAVHNLIGGDGDDTLIAGADGAWLDGGRGYNLLKGGGGTDRYVIHKRAEGRDELEQFERSREVVDLIGFGNKAFTDLQLSQDGETAVVGLGNGQTLRFAQQTVADLQPSNFRFLDTLITAPGYFDGSPEGQVQEPSSGTVLLSGGSGGVSLTSDASGQLVASLTGTIYGPASVAPSVFVVEKQDGVTNYKNTVRGFRHGIDKIDLSQTGISRYEDLQLTKDERFQLNGFAQIHGVTVAGQDSTVQLLYLDALELAQVTVDDFIFAPPAAATLPGMAPLEAPNLANLVDAMAAFAPEAASTKLLAEAPTPRWESTIAVAA
ncbi:S8 family serine peptidase [Pseudomonas putida]